MARHTDVLTMPAVTVLQTTEGDFCWVRTAETVVRCSLQLGDTDDQFIIVETGVAEGDEVVLDPLASIDEAQVLALRTFDKATLTTGALEDDHVE